MTTTNKSGALLARISLKDNGPLEHTTRGRTLKRGASFTTGNAAEINAYKSMGQYNVDILSGKLESAPAVRRDAPAEEPAEDGEGEPEEPEAAAEGEPEEPAEEEQPDRPATSYVRADLEKLSKSALIQRATGDGLPVALNINMSKKDIIDAMMGAVSE